MMKRHSMFKEMETLQREMERTLNGLGIANSLEATFLPGIGTRRYPKINIHESAEAYHLEALLPGVKGEEIEMSFEDGSLSLSGERKEAVGGKGKTWHRRERGGGKFLRTIELPGEIDTEKISAEYKNGVLRVLLPKVEKAKLRVIPVKVQ